LTCASAATGGTSGNLERTPAYAGWVIKKLLENEIQIGRGRFLTEAGESAGWVGRLVGHRVREKTTLSLSRPANYRVRRKRRELGGITVGFVWVAGRGQTVGGRMGRHHVAYAGEVVGTPGGRGLREAGGAGAEPFGFIRKWDTAVAVTRDWKSEKFPRAHSDAGEAEPADRALVLSSAAGSKSLINYGLSRLLRWTNAVGLTKAR